MNSVWKSKFKFGAFFVLFLLLLYAGHYFVTPKMGLQLDLVWSPDSKHVAYVCRYHYRTDYQKDGINLPGYKRIDDVNTGEICMFDLETNRFERLTYGRYKTDPSWLPDGSRLSWYDKKNGLAVYDLRTGETVFDVNLIYDPEQYEQNDELSPDGRYLIDYIGGGTADDPYDGFFFTIIENEQVLFKSDFKIAPVPAWSPSSSMLGLRKYGWHDFVFMRFPEIEITSFQTQHPFDFVSWSPDGKTIAFQNHEFLQIVVFEFRANPFSYSVVDKTTFQLTGMVKHGDISWSPDGKYIIFKSGEILRGFGDGGRVIAPEKYWALDWKNNEQFPLFVEPWHFACNSC